jgi:AcrR family transcriptional regulator
VSFEVKARALPKGRHNLPLHVVRASQRERLLESMLNSVAERGYAATTVPKVVADAKVSRNAFYALFSDKTDCFIALCDELAAELLEYFASLEGDTWVDLLRSGASHYLRFWAERPAFARTYFVELPAAGPRAWEQRDRQYERFLAAFVHFARLARPDGDLPPLVPRLLVVSITELVAEEVRAGRTERLPEIEDDLVDVMVRLLSI